MRQNIVTISDDPGKLHAFIEKHLPPKQVEKKLYGEVFTPLWLVRDMLGAITKYVDKDYWKNKDLKILDPAAGIGNFPLVAYELLMDGLKTVIPNEEARRKHILEEMLYMVELNPVNARLMQRIFNGQKYNLNILNTNFLVNKDLNKKQQEDLKKLEKWKETKFDLVMGNPPYQPPSNDKKGGKSIWPDFVEQSYGALKVNGLLTFIHPSLWRKPSNSLHDIFFKNQMHYLVIKNEKQGNEIFSSSTRVDWYLLQKTKTTHKTHITFEDNNTTDILISDKVPFIPNFGMKIFLKLWNISSPKIQAMTDSACHTSRPFVSNRQDKGYVYKLINSISKTNGLSLTYSS